MTDREKIEQLQSLLDAYRAENYRLISKADALKKELEDIGRQDKKRGKNEKK